MNTHFKVTRGRRMAIVLGTVLACGLGLHLTSALGAQGCWSVKADMPLGMAGGAGCEVDGILYVAGGFTEWGNAPPLAILFAYDPKTDTWTRKQDMPTARMFAAASAVDGIIYVIGGGDPRTDTFTAVVEAYDPKTDTWTVKSSLPVATGNMPACTLDGRIYVIGGLTTGLEPRLEMRCYDPKTDQWTRKANLPVESAAAVAQVVNGLIYLFTGKSTYAYDPSKDLWTLKGTISCEDFDPANAMGGAVDGMVYLMGGFQYPSGPASSQSFAYDPGPNHFSSRRAMPHHCALAAYATIDGKIYVAGGVNNNPIIRRVVCYQSLWVFDPHGGTTPGAWVQKAKMPGARAAAAACQSDGILYVAGGESTPGIPLSTLFAYNPKTGSWKQLKDMPTARSFAAASAVSGVVFVIGGGDALPIIMTDAVEAYDPKTDTWTVKAPLPTKRGAMAACTLDGLIYVMGGKYAEIRVDCYDPNTNQWTRKKNLPYGCTAPVAQVVNGVMYLFSEYKVLVYDATNDQWTLRASQSYGGLNCVASSSGTVDGTVFLLGGSSEAAEWAENRTLAYDPCHNCFSGTRMLPMGCFYGASATIDGRIYLAGGANGDPIAHSDVVVYDSLWMYDPQGGVMPQILSITRETANTVRLVWRGEAGRLYGVKRATKAARASWASIQLHTGPTIRATNDVVEAIGTVPGPATANFFQVHEAD